MALSDLQNFSMDLPLLLSGVSLLIVVSFIRFLVNRPKKLGLPVLEGKSFEDHQRSFIEGTLRYPDSPFVIPTAPALVVLPISVIDEVRNLPENKVSFLQDVRRMFVSKHTGIGMAGPEVIQTVKGDLTRHIASTLDGLQDEIRFGFDKELGPCHEWTPVQVYPKMARIVALLSGRVFVGRPLSRDEEWIEATIMYTFYCVEAARKVKSYPEYLRSIVAPFLAEVKRVKKFKNRGAELLQPLINDQLSRDRNEKLSGNKKEDEKGNMISWILKITKEGERHDPRALANHQMGLSMAAIHTTTMAVTSAIYDFAAHPEFIQPLRDEIQQVIDEDGYDVDGDGFKKFKKSSIPRLWKLDSFLKESQRLSPPQLPANVRVTTAPLTLSTGHTLPTGTRIGFSAWAISNSPTTSLFAPTATHTPLPPSTFDGLRFYKLRKIPGNENKHQFVTTSPESLNFGHGNHACPGRFFASNEIKVVLIELLRNWEFRFKGDVEQKGGRDMRPVNKGDQHELSCYPDQSAVVEFRRR